MLLCGIKINVASSTITLNARARAWPNMCVLLLMELLFSIENTLNWPFIVITPKEKKTNSNNNKIHKTIITSKEEKKNYFMAAPSPPMPLPLPPYDKHFTATTSSAKKRKGQPATPPTTAKTSNLKKTTVEHINKMKHLIGNN